MSMLQRALQLHLSGHLAKAEALYREILGRESGHHSAWHLLGVVLKQRGEWEAGLDCIQRALAIEPGKAVYHNNQGAVLLDLGRDAEAQSAFESAVTLNATYPDALSNLGQSFAKKGENAAAASLFDRALLVDPGHLDTMQRYGRLCMDQGQFDEAVSWFERALDVRPDWSDALTDLGNAQRVAGKLPESAVTFRRALEIDPNSEAAAFNLGVSYSDAEMMEPASRYFVRAASLRPDRKLWKLRTALCCPAVFESCNEIAAYRARLDETLDELLAAPERWTATDLLTAGCVPPFNMTHHGADNRQLKEKFAKLFEPSFPQRPRTELAHGRRRVGFVVTAGHENIFLRCMAPTINLLDNRQFEVVVFCSPSTVTQIHSDIGRPDLGIVSLSGRFERAVATIHEARCDLLHHWEIGTDPLNYFLAYERLSPVQFTSWGIPETSGIASVDYYLASQYVEAESAQKRYTERLWLLNSLLTYQRRVISPPLVDREHFGLPADGALYLCPQRLQKFHPDFDALIGGILRADPTGHFIAMQGRPASTAAMQRRFARTLADVCDRVHFLPRQTRDEYYRLLQLADVILDPPHYSAGSSSYDIFSFNLPVVTLPGPLQASRYTTAYYNRMGLSELVPETPEAYVQLAVQIANDREFRQSIVKQLADRGDQIFGQVDYVDQLSTFLEHIP